MKVNSHSLIGDPPILLSSAFPRLSSTRAIAHSFLLPLARFMLFISALDSRCSDYGKNNAYVLQNFSG
jgi:hypothetical protein